MEPTKEIPSIIGNYKIERDFLVGDYIYIYEEYANLSHDNIFDFSVNISVEHWDTHFILYYNESNHICEKEDGCYWGFLTNETWMDGLYLVTANLVDHISKRFDLKDTYFFLNEKS